MLSKGKMNNELFGGSCAKSQKGEKLIDGVEVNFYQRLMACESR